MTTLNPTPVKVGMQGAFVGKTYRVIGRVVMGITEDGSVYTWNEYNLETAAGDRATLVYEESDGVPSWKMFTMFDPQFPISAEDAASKGAGDLVNLDGTDCHVTRVDHSRIYFLEGQGFEGETVYAKADYFNASGAGNMIVVSWTGSEVECYRGINITSGMVAKAFNLGAGLFPLETGPSSRLSASNDDEKRSALRSALTLFGIAAVLIFLEMGRVPFARGRATVKEYQAPSASFEPSGEGNLQGKTWRVLARSTVLVSRVNVRCREREYALTNDLGEEALLVQGFRPGSTDWTLFTPLHPAKPIPPLIAAKFVAGDFVDVDGVVAAVTDLFLSEVLRAENVSGDAPRHSGDMRYGFQARKNNTVLLAIWNAKDIEFYQGTDVGKSEIKTFAKASN